MYKEKTSQNNCQANKTPKCDEKPFRTVLFHIRTMRYMWLFASKLIKVKLNIQFLNHTNHISVFNHILATPQPQEACGCRTGQRRYFYAFPLL